MDEQAVVQEVFLSEVSSGTLRRGQVIARHSTSYLPERGYGEHSKCSLGNILCV